jgi:hypothetical protein
MKKCHHGVGFDEVTEHPWDRCNICWREHDDIARQNQASADREALPRYVSMGGVLLCLTKDKTRYYRPAGQWAVRYEEKDGELFSVAPPGRPWMGGIPLKPATRVEFEKDNQGYL